jgi:hypothetical protein
MFFFEKKNQKTFAHVEPGGAQERKREVGHLAHFLLKRR